MFGEPPDDQNVVLAAWTLPLIVAAIAVAIVGGFYLGGPGLGLAVGALCGASIIVVAVRAVPRGPIVSAPLTDLRHHILLISRGPLEDPRAITTIADLCETADPWAEASEVRLLVPASPPLLDRWTGDRRAGLAAAQRNSVLSLAALTKAGLDVKASIGDRDVVLAVEDELRTYPATDVILLGEPGDRAGSAEVAAELRSRLRADFLHLEYPDQCAEQPRRLGRRAPDPGSGRRSDPLRGPEDSRSSPGGQPPHHRG